MEELHLDLLQDILVQAQKVKLLQYGGVMQVANIIIPETSLKMILQSVSLKESVIKFVFITFDVVSSTLFVLKY